MTKEGKTFFEVFSQGTSGREQKSSGRPGEDLLVISDVSSDRPKRSWRGPYRVGLETIVLGAVGGVLLAVGCFFLGLKLGDHRNLAKGQLESATTKVATAEKGSPKRPAPVAKAQVPAAKVPQEKPGNVPIAKVSHEKPNNAPVAKASFTPKAVPAEKDTWSLRVIAYKEGGKGIERATNLATTLKERTGHDAFVAKQGSTIVVCLGEFDSRDSAQLLELQKSIRELKYENKMQFAGCYPVKVK